MESDNYAIKLVPFFPDPSEVSIPIAASIKQRWLTLKPTNSRYDTWSEDVHAAFMEAINIYPPMGKQKQSLRHINISQDNTDGDVGSSRPERQFGRCQLIQLYILEKTGKNRTRKQVSSHLQYLERLSRKRPPKRASFHETSRLTQEPPERDSPVSSPEGSQSPDTTPPMSLSFCQASPSDDMLSIVRRASEEQEPGAKAAHGTCSTYYVNNGYRSSSTESHRVFDPTITPLRLPPLSTWTTMGPDSSDTGYEFSLPLGRLSNNLSPLTWESEGSTSVYSSQVHLSPEYQVPHHAARNNSKFTTMDSLCSYPLTPVDEPYFAPLQSPQIMPFERQTVAPDNFDRSCHLLHNSGSLLHFSYASHTSRTGLPPISIPLLSFSGIQSSPLYTGMSDFLLDHKGRYRVPKLLPYSDAYDTTPYAQLADPQLSHHPRCGHAEEQLEFASPLLFKPNPRYPAAYAHTEDSTLELSHVPAL